MIKIKQFENEKLNKIFYRRDKNKVKSFTTTKTKKPKLYMD
jgi:hypothetical protein